MRRRTFLGVVGCTATVGIAGCLDDDPEPEITGLRNPVPIVNTVDNVDDDYLATIRNEGSPGLVRVELFFIQNEDTPQPRESVLYGGDDNPEVTFDSATQESFSGGQTREITMTAVEESNTEWFDIFPHAATYRAVIQNNGSAGEIEVSFRISESRGYDIDIPAPKHREIGSDQQIHVDFDVVLPGQVSYEVVAEPR